MSDKKKVLYVCTPSHTERVFHAETWQRMIDTFDVT